MKSMSCARAAMMASISLTGILAASPGQAQGTPPVEEPQPPATAQAVDEPVEAGSQEIIVTARRREETLQDVPIAVTAYTGEQLERQGSLDITDIGDTTPNVTLETSRGSNTTLTAFIRGVGQQDPVAGFEQGVGIYLDDVYLNRPQGALLDIYDVERIEVLRGPQGTLYGRNTIGGAVKYVTRRLGNDPRLTVRANLGTDDLADLIVSGSAPVTDTLRVGGAVARLSRGGFGKNLTTGRENYNKDIYATRGTIEFEPSDRVFFRLSGDYTWDYSNERGGHRLIAGQLTGAPVLDDEFDSRGALVTPKQKVKGGGLALHGEFDVTDQVKLRSITAYRKDKTSTPIDFDALPSADVDVPAIYRNKQFSQELQLLYAGERLSGLVGLYYLDANANNIFDVVLDTTSPVLPGLTASTFGDVDTKTYAAFADFTYELTDRWSVSVGGRYTVDKRDAVVVRRNLLFGPSPELGGTPVGGLFPAGRQLGPLTSDFTGDKTFKEFTPRASITFEPNANNTIYASYSKGFKGGGFDPRGLSTAPQADLNGDGVKTPDEIFDFFLFEPEKVDSYEVGYKASLFDRRLSFALAAFYADYKDVQVPASVGAIVNGTPTFVGLTTNAGAASFKGLELEGTAALARDFAGVGSRINLSGTLGYLDAQYDEFVTDIAFFNPDGTPNASSASQPIDVADFRRIQNTPKWTASGTVDFSAPVARGRVDANATASYRSKTYQFETPSPFLDQPGYTLIDANLIYSWDRFKVGLHGKNLTDKRYITSGYQFLTVNPVTGAPILAATPLLPSGAPNPNFGVPGVAPSLGREGVVTAYYGSPRQVFLSFEVDF
jgi:iron complex outermembrane receptor protein